MIVTARPKIPQYWILIAILPWSAFVFQYMILNNVFTFSLKKFIDNPAGLTFVMSLPGFVSMFANPVVNFMSDRVWTRFGRRKPFVIFSWIGTITCMILLPLMPSFWSLLAVFLIFNLFNDFAGPIDSLKQEIAPPQDRGRLTAGWSWMTQFSILVFFSVALGRFDDQEFMAGVPITGEQALYWSVALGIFCMLMIIVLCIKETNPHSTLVGEKFSVKTFFKGVLHRHLWPVYTLIVSTALLQSGLGVMGNLLYTDQWNFTMQEMGTNIAIGGVLNLFLIAFLGIFADKMDRGKAYLTLNLISMAINAFFYIYVNFVLYDSRPSLVELVVFGETLSIVGILSGMIFYPLCYDFVPRNEMGTFNAGMQMLNRLVGIVTLNGVGIFMTVYATTFLPPGGEMTRVVLRDVQTREQVEAEVAKMSWVDTVGGKPVEAASVTARPWYATGAALDHSRAFELRIPNDDSIKKKERRDELDGQRSTLTAQEANESELGRQAGLRGDDAARQQREAAAAELRAKIKPIADEVSSIDAELARRAKALREQVERNFAATMLKDGEQILAAGTVPVAMAGFQLSGKPFGEPVERTLDELRKLRSGVVDVRIDYTKAGGFRLLVAVRQSDGADAAAATAGLGEALIAAATKADAKLAAMITGPEVKSLRTVQAVSMDLRIIEDPLDRHVSPITSVVNAVLGIFTDMPGPERRLFAVGRSMRKAKLISHGCAEALPGDEAAIRLIAVPSEPNPDVDVETDTASVTTPASPDAAHQAINARITGLMTGSSALFAEKAIGMYDQLVTAAGEQRMTVASPIIKTDFAPQKYDYMCGYIWMFIMQILGLFITWSFLRKVKSGEIRRRGVEEAQASA